MSKRSNYANASAFGREQKITDVFLALAREQFAPTQLLQKVPVTPKVMLSYLKAIQKANFKNHDYIEFANRPYQSKSYGQTSDPIQLEFIEQLDTNWKNKAKAEIFHPSGKTNSLGGGAHSAVPTNDLMWIYVNDNIERREQCYNNLELSILYFTFITAPKSKKVKKD